MTSTPCLDCGAPVAPNALGSWWEATGWIELRREQGLKGNSVRRKEFTGRALCRSCGQMRELGINPNQETLL